MKLKYLSEFLSITSFKDVELAKFTVLTGLNGAGKTHLVKAIKNGNVHVDDIPGDQVIVFDSSLFVLDNEPVINSKSLQEEKNWIYSTIKDYIMNRNFIEVIKGFMDLLMGLAKTTGKSFYDLTMENLLEQGWAHHYNAYEQYRRNVLGTINNISTGTNPHITKPALQRLSKEIKKPLELLTREELDQFYVPIFYKNDFLIHQLGKVFSDYWEKWELNVYRKFRNEHYNEKHLVYSEEEFKQEYGDKPWDIINTIIAQFGSLDYKVNSPEGLERGHDYQLKLISTKDRRVEIDFSHLSSGERTMMALVSSLYKSKIDKYFPRLLLLDEIDASLHPSMSKSMLDVLQKEFVEKKGLQIILITHSPSTVALAPENTVFVMNKMGPNRIVPSSNREALKILTEGFASLTTSESNLKVSYNISKTSRHVLLTEGITDKIILEAAWCNLENRELPFDVQDCFDASFLRNLFARGGIFTNYPTKTFIALFDFDREGFESWNNLSQFDIVETDPKKGLLKKHRTAQAYALLLPVPSGVIESQVIQNGVITYKDKSHMPIELLFYGVPALNSQFINEPQVGGGNLIKFQGDKVSFANDVATKLTPIDYEALKPLFAVVKNIFK